MSVDKNSTLNYNEPMYELKNQIYKDFTKVQKSSLCNFLRAFVKKNIRKAPERILNKFLEDESYYLQIGQQRFEFITELLTDEKFLAETLEYIEECVKYYEYQRNQEPLKEKQRAYERKKTDYLRDLKMSKELPTGKQMTYYKRLCKSYNIVPKEISSKLQARDEIRKILNVRQRDCRETGISGD